MTVDDLRTRLTEEYGEERFTMTVTEIEQRAGTGARRRVTGWAAAGMAALAAVAFLVWPTGGTGIVQPLTSPSVEPTGGGEPAWHASFVRDCEQKWLEQDRGSLPPELRDALPPLRFDVSRGESGMRVFAPADTGYVVECERNARQTTVSLATAGPPFARLLGDTGAELPYYGRSGFPDENGVQQDPDFYIGRVPAGVREIEAHVAGGGIVQGLIDDRMFLIWAPEGGLRDATLRAFGDDRMYIAGGSEQVDGAYQEQTLAAACGRGAARFGRLGFPDLPTLRIGLRAGDEAGLLYGDEHLMVACMRTADGSVTVTEVAALQDPSSTWHPMQFNYADRGERGWLLGLAPEGAVQARAVLDSGKKVELGLSQGWFGGWWSSPATVADRPALIEVFTRTEVWQWKGGTVTHRPR
ncbi:hypothetical protein QEZ54_35290 [Catellatospora sp. KI3]|uniref:hypothetical protein n=1 Tax=Catellatospora sp. KI3 TaxID=3041620 RepID=UPI002482A0E1|nr:hypothetical protein [Catellatospora sp. KI3]MDI1466256.1 hypothetical protein [Catellatospora sp. KI3]